MHALFSHVLLFSVSSLSYAASGLRDKHGHPRLLSFSLTREATRASVYALVREELARGALALSRIQFM